MIFYGIVLIVIGLIGLAFDRALPPSRPVSTLVMYVGIGVGFLLLVVGLIVYATHGAAIEVDSLGGITVR